MTECSRTYYVHYTSYWLTAPDKCCINCITVWTLHRSKIVIIIQPYHFMVNFVVQIVIVCMTTLSRKLYNVTGFAKRGLPHTSNSLNLEDHNLAIADKWSWNFLQSLSYVGTFCWPNFKSVACTNLKLWIVKVGKLDVCGRPLFANPVTYIAIL